uniref:Uncharacterized protein n=1 Tax=Glossina palpalis gambiensis TaxID=67801 RepID=A0A1B0AS83_9MUSC
MKSSKTMTNALQKAKKNEQQTFAFIKNERYRMERLLKLERYNDSTIDWGTFSLLLFDKPPGTRNEHMYVNSYFEGVKGFLNVSASLALLCPKGIGNEVRFKMVVSICRFCESSVLSACGANVVKLILVLSAMFKLLLASVLFSFGVFRSSQPSFVPLISGLRKLSFVSRLRVCILMVFFGGLTLNETPSVKGSMESTNSNSASPPCRVVPTISSKYSNMPHSVSVSPLGFIMAIDSTSP